MVIDYLKSTSVYLLRVFLTIAEPRHTRQLAHRGVVAVYVCEVKYT